jgi:actin related protein 2/3 complex subunit 2
MQKTLEQEGGAPSKNEDGTAKPSEHLMAVHYRCVVTTRDGHASLLNLANSEEEAIYVIPSDDRVTVIFSTVFREETDRIFGKVFLQEFYDARRLPSIQSAPQVLYSNREPPSEIRHLPGLSSDDNVCYMTFGACCAQVAREITDLARSMTVLFPRHFSHPATAAKTISQIQLFRDYLHYHIKCSKAYMHSRMRARVAEFLKVLNRAKPEVAEKEKKTASGRSFVRS